MLSEVLKGPNQKLPGEASGKVSVGFNAHVHDEIPRLWEALLKLKWSGSLQGMEPKSSAGFSSFSTQDWRGYVVWVGSGGCKGRFREIYTNLKPSF